MDALMDIWRKLRPHLTKIVLALMFGLCGAVVWQVLNQSNIPVEGHVDPSMWNPPAIIEVDSEVAQFITTYTSPVAPIHETPLANLVVLNAWEIREGVSAEELQREALSLNQQAQAAYRDGNLTQALELARRAFERDPGFTENNRFMERIRSELAGQVTPAAPAVPPAPQPPATP